MRFGQALADLAVLGLSQEHDGRRSERLAELALTTVNERAHINQAVGLVAGTLGLSPETARARIIAFAHRNDASLRAIAHRITHAELSADTLSEPATTAPAASQDVADQSP